MFVSAHHTSITTTSRVSENAQTKKPDRRHGTPGVPREPQRAARGGGG